jgi:hypothetical protein
MPVDDLNQSPRPRMPRNLISAVQAAARYSSDRKRAHRSIKNAGENADNKERRKPPRDES